MILTYAHILVFMVFKLPHKAITIPMFLLYRFQAGQGPCFANLYRCMGPRYTGYLRMQLAVE